MKRPFLTSSRYRSVGGFTLLELMTAVAILGILLAIGVPAFTETMNANRLAATTNEMVTALSVARSEASKRGIAVTVCAANAAQDGCSGAASWNDGWIVFTDDAGTAGRYDNGSDELLQVFAAPVAGFPVTATNPATLTYIRFLRSGSPDSGPATRTLKLSRPSCTGTKARQISIATTGRISSGKIAC
ncbi:MAG TPA: GspH/FimT family pseudopilin [Steroidobacteraceae bacterium]